MNAKVRRKKLDEKLIEQALKRAEAAVKLEKKIKSIGPSKNGDKPPDK